MMTTWQNITQVMPAGLSIRVESILAQSPSLPTSQANGFDTAVQKAFNQLGAIVPNLLGAVALLVVGWIVASIAKAIVRGILNRTSIDNRIAASLTGRSDAPQVENFVAGFAFWVVFLIFIVAVLDTLQLKVASQPLASFLTTIGDFLPKLLGAGILIGTAWLIATLVRLLVVRALDTFGLDEKLNPPPQDGSSNLNQLSLSETIGSALYWFIFLLFLMPVLDTLGLTQAIQPINALTTEILSILPNVFGAVLIGVVGWFAANIVRRIVTNLLATTGVDNIGSQIGLRSGSGTQSLSSIIGTVVYVLILIPVAISSLNALQIEAISRPAISMLQQVLNVLPSVFTAGSILAISYFLGRFIGEFVTGILTSLGFNNIFSVLGLPNLGGTTTASPAEEVSTTRTPSEIAGIIVQVGIILFATIAALDILNIPALTTLFQSLLAIFGQILTGLVVLAIGLYLANLAFSIITSSGNPQARILAQVARIAIIAFVGAMSLNLIGVAPSIVQLAFGLLLSAIAGAIIIAFGLGGRDIAREQMQEWLNSFKNK